MARLASAAMVLAIVAAMVNDAQAQSYPERPVRLVIGVPPGGGTDFVTRILAQKLGERWSQQAIIDNRPGANQIIATEFVAKAKPDGLTILIANSGHAINPAFYRKLPYDTQADFEPVSLLAQYPFLLVVHPALPVRSVRDLISVARAQPGQLSFASSGNGSAPHLGMKLFESLAGVKIIHVPYKGAGPAITDLVSGQVQLMLLNLAPVKGFIQEGRLRALAVASPARSESLPGIPTVSESGLPRYHVVGWYGMFLPAGVPRAIKNKLQSDVANVLRADDVKRRLLIENTEPVGNSSEEFADFLKQEMARYAAVISKTGVERD